MKFKNLKLFIGSTLILLASCGEDNTNSNKKQIIINTNNLDSSEYIFINKLVNNEFVPSDSSKATNKISFNIDSNKVGDRLFITSSNNNQYLPVFIDNNTINIDLNNENMSESKITGSPTHDLYQNFMNTGSEKLSIIEAKIDTVTSDSSKNLIIEEYYTYYEDSVIPAKKLIIENNLMSPIAPLLLSFSQNDLEYEDFKVLAKKSIEKNNTQYAKDLSERLNVLESVEIGKIAPEINLTDSNGNILPLSSLRGKTVLLDFWASWCGPCRRENPNVVKAYNKYKDNNFTVYGVSLDNQKEAWLQAIKMDNLTWSHVSDLKGWGSKGAETYGVRSIPASFLIDENGTIIGKDLRGDELHKKLEEILN